MSGKLSVFQALVIVLLAAVVAWVPFVLGGVFGYGAILVTPLVAAFCLVGLGVVLGRMAPTGKWVRVAFATFVIAAVYTGLLAYPPNPNPVMTMYVVVPAAKGPSFTGELARVLKDRGVDADLGQSRPYGDEIWMKAYRLEATKGLVWVWSSNTTMSGYVKGRPDGRCLPAGETPRPDPGQYLIMVNSRRPCAGEAAAATFFHDLRRDLVSRGYDVRDASVPCAHERGAPP